MKSKVSTYVLTVLVVLIWGLIFFRVFNSWEDDDYERPSTRDFVKERYNDYSFKDTTRLNLNYPDPFRISTRTFKPVLTRPEARAIKPMRTSPDWKDIGYSGYIKNPRTGKTLALINVNGRNVVLAEGQTVDNIRLMKTLRDSIKISAEGNVKYIPITASD